MTFARQFALPFPQDAAFEPGAFLRGLANEAALAWSNGPENWPLLRLAISGEAGVGKTHLLHLFAHRHRAALLSAEELGMFMPLPHSGCLAIDDADMVKDERVLLHVLNTASDRRMAVLLAGRTAPSHWSTKLPDLNSRLRAITVVVLSPPDDALLRLMLSQLVAERQLHVPDHVQAYMLLHLPRTGGALREAVARLDRLTLATGGHVTRALAARAIDAVQLTDDAAPSYNSDLLNATPSA